MSPSTSSAKVFLRRSRKKHFAESTRVLVEGYEFEDIRELKFKDIVFLVLQLFFQLFFSAAQIATRGILESTRLGINSEQIWIGYRGTELFRSPKGFHECFNYSKNVQ
jgi:hypothetical protein